MPGDDGLYWTTRGRLADNLQDVVYAGDIGEQGLFVAVGSSGTILTSLFAGAWYEEYSGVGDNLYAVNSGNGIWLVGGRNKTTGKPVIWRSTNNAVSWTQVTFPYTQGGYVMDMAYTGSEFVSVGINFIYASTNGVTWVHRYTPPTNLYGVAVGDYNVVAVGPNGLACTSEFCN